MRLSTKRRTNRSWYDSVHAQSLFMLALIRKFARQRSDARFRDCVTAPIRARILAATVEREHNGRVVGGVEQANRCTREAHRRRDVDAQQREPRVERLMLDRSERAEHRSGMDEGVEAAKLRFDPARDVREIVGACLGEIERQNDWLRVTRAGDVVVERFEFADDAPMENDGRTGSGARDRQRVPESAGSSSNEDDAIAQLE